MSPDLVLLEVTDGVATVTINRPERRNAWTIPLSNALAGALRRCDQDPAVRAVVVTGAGVAFSVGADMSGGDLRNPGTDQVDPDDVDVLFPYQIGKPVIAAINGDAVGAGISYSMLCDLRIVAAEAKVGFVFARRGIIAEMGAHWSLPRAVGSATALDLMLTGRIVRGPEAVEIGLCHRTVAAAEVLSTAREVAAGIARDIGPTAAAITKRLLWEDFAERFARDGARELALLTWCVEHGEASEGVASFLERRAPVWRQNPATDLPEDLLAPASAAPPSAPPSPSPC